ncbi:MAG: dihydrodipicolinate synthase family protein [Ornithinimicrobium sp.]|uniref:dihydrodipicolinate synthase family protein n=1 Tax=Ornithinimicrobium sp. TaxID=1977084 RepID=UPI0026DED9A9|nr:dihydrodipicolinate synthase family protein [Ornithinimicrobium sp.]MDO5739768.1 dihydrodipicolinate synthase family protein [Ornithinimicrobium sp.]
MDRTDVTWYGYIPAITTPFGQDGAIAWADFAAQLEWLIDQRMDGIILAGTTGEWSSLLPEERIRLFHEGARHVRGRIPVLGGCNAFTAREAIIYAREAEKAGLDGILLAPPPYIVPSAREIVQFYTDVSDGSNIPLCIYNWPRGCSVDIDSSTLDELADVENIVALKNSTQNTAGFLSSLYGVSDRLRVFGLPTSALGVDLALAGRGSGLMGSGGVLGSDHSDFWRAITAGDREQALRLGDRDRVLMESWFTPDYGTKFGNTAAIMKTALRYRGVPAGVVRRPLLDLTPSEVSLVHDTLQRLQIKAEPARW